jgi:photosystem II stability/assembly factor-like uncharacterized protein
VGDERTTDPTSRVLGDFVRHVSDQVIVPPFRAAEQTTARPGGRRGERRWVAAVVGTVAVAGAVILAVVYGPRSSVTDNGVAHQPTSATWTVVAADRWPRQFGPPNISNFGAPDTITCAPGSISTCDVTVNTVSVPEPSVPTSAAYRTTDSGSTWRKLSLPAHPWLSSAFSCSGPSTCAVGAAVGIGATGTPDFSGRGAVLTTDDGGRRWTVHDLPSAFGLVTDLSCPTPTHCVVFAWRRGADPLPNPYAGFDRFYPTTVLTTDDGGRTWSVAALPPASPPSVRYALASNSGGSLTCPTVTTCDATGEQAEIITTDGSYVQQDARSVALVSGNGGRSWTVTHRTDIGGADTLSIACAGGSTCRMIANPGPGLTAPYEVFASDDGGRRWSSVSSTGLPLPSVEAVASMTCASVDDCVLAANGNGATGPTLLTTTDGGRVWRSEALPAAPVGASVAGFSCGSSGPCLALIDESLATPPFALADDVLTNAARPAR